MSLKDYENILSRLSDSDRLRTLARSNTSGKYITVDDHTYINFASNDYLGIASDTDLQNRFFNDLDTSRFILSNPSSRLMTGNSREYCHLEDILAGLYPGRDTLVLGNGYLANTGLLPALTGRADLILADKLVHASIIDGIRLCRCESQRFRHNDMDHLEDLIRKAVGKYDTIWVVTESVFSMDGDVAPLLALTGFKEKYGVSLYIDEAHAFGVFGPDGAGIAAAEGVSENIDVIVATFGKAIASCGAFAAVAPAVKKYLVNTMRTLIFSTALPPVSLLWTAYVLSCRDHLASQRDILHEHIRVFGGDYPGTTQIFPLMTYTDGGAVRAASEFRQNGLWAQPIRPPSVPEGKSRLRVSLTAALDKTDIEKLKTVCGLIG